MRLKKIRLAGFKSFVDPTTVHLPGQLVGIVGPNGCGKSNVIDAVRWVMGESSARHLRGDSMTDVIFNGSGSRKPVGQASIELVFDNSEGGLGGQYSAYAEISVRRQVNREGQSQYFLNGSRCRRRDVTDVFLGTGLGPRSYAIIEQGMISRIIEAKPEELRVYLEEAAGISLYKERRKETERRIRSTRENMDRLNDVRDEVATQLEKLSRQARTAERYKELKTEERRLRAELLALRLQDLGQSLDASEQEIRQRETALEAAVSRQRAAERELVSGREQQSEFGESLNRIQGRYYGLGSDIARIEQQINHHRELHRRRAEEQASNNQALDELRVTLEQDAEKLAVLDERIGALEPEMEECRGREDEAAALVEERSEAMHAWQQRWDDFNARAADSLQQAEVERTRIEHLEDEQHQLQRRLERLEQEQAALDPESLVEELDALEEEETALSEQRDALDTELERREAALGELREQEQCVAESLRELHGERQRREARLTSLETLQQDSLADSSGAVAALLEQYDLAGADRLAQLLDVDPGWEKAVERVLADRLQAVCGSPSPALLESLAALERGSLTLLDTARESGKAPANGPLPPLLDVIRAPWPLDDLLGGVWRAESLEQALAVRDRLGASESVVTADGYWLGPRWLRVTNEADAGDGVIVREREMAGLGRQLAADEARVGELEEQLRQLRDRLEDGDGELRRLRDERAAAADALQAAVSRRESRAHRLEDMRARQARLDEEQEDLRERLQDSGERVREARARLQEALDRNEELDRQRDELQQSRDETRQTLEVARDDLRARREARHELSLKLQGAETARESIREQVRRLESQRERLEERAASLQEAADQEGDPTAGLETERESLLEQRLVAEGELAEARRALGEVEQRLRELDQNRLAAETEAEGLRSELEAARLRQQELKVRHQTLIEQFRELDQDLAAIQEALPEEATEDGWLNRLGDLENRISRLGSINLAAIEEHAELSERKGYLDQQHADLSEALETLESAIRRIDRETRSRFRETFDRVNAGLRNMYPKLFGGGEAYLELTGEDLLDTGVSILARPPGKRISNIHLLSGGEKALTAVAMIFAIFELNPAPFCMLDEVDAPLDEANVGRFCQLVREMSDRVQFVFITHNKATMEIASHLMGVTMHEPGVSRLVAVDVDEAAEMAVA